jgi:hypothetical protein
MTELDFVRRYREIRERLNPRPPAVVMRRPPPIPATPQKVYSAPIGPELAYARMKREEQIRAVIAWSAYQNRVNVASVLDVKRMRGGRSSASRSMACDILHNMLGVPLTTIAKALRVQHTSVMMAARVGKKRREKHENGKGNP